VNAAQARRIRKIRERDREEVIEKKQVRRVKKATKKAAKKAGK
jgi:hypothetical protein